MEVEPQESLTRLDLPEEIWINIFRRLDVKSIQNSQLVCKKWLDFILNDVILSGEYRFPPDLFSSQINGILAKRKKLKIVRFPHPYEYRARHSKLSEYSEEDLGMMLDLRYIDFRVCKDLTKVICRQYDSGFVKMPPLPQWVKPVLFWFDPSNQTVLFGPEHTVELSLYIKPENGILELVDPSIEMVAKNMTNLEKLRVIFEPEALDNIYFMVPILKGLQHCQSLRQLEISCRPHSHLSILLQVISEWCPNITHLKLKPSTRYNVFHDVYWCSNITKFRNLEKLEIDLYLVPVINWQSDIDFDGMIESFYDNPMTTLKELKLNTVNVFFQDGFLSWLPKFFPNLQTFNLAKLGKQGDFDTESVKKKVSCWTFIELRSALRSLGSVKNLYLPSMEIVLEAAATDIQTFRKTERVFYQALEIIKTQFPLSIGDLKIIDDKHGFVILKEKMKPPKMFNQQQINGRSVVKVEHFEDSKTVRLKLKPKGQKGSKKTNEKHEKEDEIVLSAELIKRLYSELIAKSSQ